MKLLLLIALVIFSPLLVAGQARTAERIVSVTFSQLDPTGNLPNGEVRHIVNGTQGTTPCTGGGTGAMAMKIAGVWHCPKFTPGTGAGDVLGAASSLTGQLAAFTNTSGKSIGPITLTGVLSVSSGIPTALASSGTGSVILSNSATLNAPSLLSPTISSFANAQHTHASAAGGGQLDATSVFSSGTVPPARVITGTIANSRCLRTSNVGQIEVAAFDCGAGGGGSPGGVSGNLTFNESGAFGGIANSAYNAATGSLTFNQLANGNDTLLVRRATDSSPTGTLLRFRDAANTTDLFTVSAGGAVSASSTVTLKTNSAPSTPSAGNTVLWADVTDKNLKAQDDAGNVSVTMRPISCSGTDKVSAISSAGVITCTADQGGSGTGVITLNTLNASDQSFAAVDDTNIDLTISSSVSTHTFTLAWAGTLAKARQNAATVYNDQANTWTIGVQSFAAAALLVLPTSAGAAPTSSGSIAYDATSNTAEIGVNGTNRIIAFTAGSQTFSDKTLDNSTTANLRDTQFTLQDNTDITKTVNFELAGVSTGTNRVITVPNANSVTVQPTTATTNQFVTHIDSNGVVQKAQPSFANLSGTMGPTQGGTGQTTVAQGDLLYGDATNSWARLPKSTAATRYLANTGASNNPQWDQVNLANGVTGTLNDANLSANVSLLGPAIDLSGAEATGVLAAARFPALTGDVTTASGSLSTTIANDAVTNAKLANMATATFKGRVTAGTGDPEDLTGTQATSLLNTFTTTLKGLVPAPGSTTNAFLRDDGTWVVPAGGGDMVLAGVQTVTGAKTFDPAKLIVGAVSTLPTVVPQSFVVDSDDGRLYFGVADTPDFWGELFIAGLSTLNLGSNVTGTLPLANGGTNQTSWTAGRCVQVNAGGTALESASAACGSGGGGTPAGSDTQVQFNDGGAFGGDAGFTYNKTTDTATIAALITSGSGAGNFEMAEGTAPSAVANRITITAPTDVTALGWVMSLPTTAGTSGQFLQTNGSGVTTWATPAGSGTVTATGGSLTANSVVLGAGGTDTKVVAGITTNGTARLRLGVSGTIEGVIEFFNQTSGSIIVTAPPTGALGSIELTLPVRTATIATTVGTLTSGRCVEIDASGNFIQAAAACGSGGSGTINAGVTNAIPKYTASTTLDDSLLSDDGTTLAYSGTGGLSLTATGGGYVQFTEGTPPAIVANTVQHAVAADAPAAGVQYLWGSTTAASGILRVTNSSGVMTVTQDAGVSHLASSTSADLRGVLSDESGTGAALFVGGNIGAGTATTAAANDNTTLVATTAYVQTELTAYASDTVTFTNKTYDTSATGNVFTSTHKVFLPAAGCQNTTAASFWDLPTTTPAVAACVTGTVVQKGVLDFADTSGGFSAQTTLQLPSDFTGTIDADIKWTTTATSGNAKWSLSTICTAVDATEVDDPGAFNTASTVTTAAPGVANRVQTSAITSVTITGCSANELLHVRVFRDGNDGSDTISATARLIGVGLTIRRAQ